MMNPCGRVLVLLFLLSVVFTCFSAASPLPLGDDGVGVEDKPTDTELISNEDFQPPSVIAPDTIDSLPFVLITGANGLIGSNLVHELLKRGHRVRGTVRDPANPTKTAPLQSFPNADTHLELVAFDLKETEPQVYENLLQGGINWVFHAAAVVDFKGSYESEAQQIEEASHAVQSLLTAAQSTPSVTQFVFTSSSSAFSAGHSNDPVKSGGNYVFNEDNWSNLEGPNVPSYAKIKTLSERAAWDFVERQHENSLSFRFTSLLPTVVLGKMTSSENMSSMRLVHRLMEGKDPGQPNLFLAIVDMMDVVQAHINAASLPDTNNNYRRRFLLAQTEGGTLYLPEISAILRETFGPMGYKIPSRIVPKWILWILSFFDAELAFVYSRIGVSMTYSTARSQEALSLTYRNANETLLDAAHYLIQYGLLPKTETYQAPTISSTDEL
jgi:dihydroflavonol-4-reductase